MLNKKIVLGTANFGQLYGILKKRKIKSKVINSIIKTTIKKKINTLDTSSSYGQSQTIIGKFGNRKLKIISKIPCPPNHIEKKKIKDWISKEIFLSLEKLRLKKFDGLLLQKTELLLEHNGNEIYSILKKFQSKGFINKLGISIYDFVVLDKILKKFKFDIVQVPYNVFDQRLVKTGWINRLKKMNIEVHVRSIFLQGILLIKYHQLPRKLKKLKKSIKIWNNWLANRKYNAIQVCLNHALREKKIDKIVIGVNSSDQLISILGQKKINEHFLLPNFSIIDKKMINPIGWKNN